MTIKKIVITGGATRIGAAIAKSLADYETIITIHYNRSKGNAFKLKKELEDLGSEVYLLKADLNNLKSKIHPKGRSTLGMPGTKVNKKRKK